MNPVPRPGRRRSVLAAATVVAAFAGLLPMQAAAAPQPSSEGRPMECVMHALGNGIPLAQAIEECKVVLEFQGVGVGTGGVQVIGMTFGTVSGTSTEVSCGGGSGADPRLSDELADAKKAAEDAKQELDEFEKWLANEQPVGKDQFAAAKLQTFLRDRVNQTQAAYEAAKLGKERTVDGAGACDAITGFLQDCSLAAWKTGPCQLFTQHLQGCADATIAYTDGEPGSGCPPASPDDETVQETVTLLCSMIGRVAPDHDPCDPSAGFGFTVLITDPAEDPCPVDEHGYHTGECPPVEWDPKDIVDLGTGVTVDPRLGGPGAPDPVGGPSGPGDPKY